MVNVVKFSTAHPAMGLHAEAAGGRAVVGIQQQVQIQVQVAFNADLCGSNDLAGFGFAGYVDGGGLATAYCRLPP